MKTGEGDIGTIVAAAGWGEVAVGGEEGVADCCEGRFGGTGADIGRGGYSV